jgi:hypothetical protein
VSRRTLLAVVTTQTSLLLSWHGKHANVLGPPYLLPAGRRYSPRLRSPISHPRTSEPFRGTEDDVARLKAEEQAVRTRALVGDRARGLTWVTLAERYDVTARRAP